MLLKLQRIRQSEQGTFGRLFLEGKQIAVTCEDPPNNNQVGKSCIPAGRYKVVRHDGAHYQNVWRLENVPGRTGILIHWGNTINDTEGCILVGSNFGTLGGLPSITNSRVTVDELRKILKGDMEIVIYNPTGDA